MRTRFFLKPFLQVFFGVYFFSFEKDIFVGLNRFFFERCISSVRDFMAFLESNTAFLYGSSYYVVTTCKWTFNPLKRGFNMALVVVVDDNG